MPADCPRIPAHSGCLIAIAVLFAATFFQPGPHFAGARPYATLVLLLVCSFASPLEARSTRFSIFDFPAPVYRVDPGHAAVAMGSGGWSLTADFSLLRCVDR